MMMMTSDMIMMGARAMWNNVALDCIGPRGKLHLCISLRLLPTCSTRIESWRIVCSNSTRLEDFWLYVCMYMRVLHIFYAQIWRKKQLFRIKCMYLDSVFQSVARDPMVDRFSFIFMIAKLLNIKVLLLN